MINDQSIGRVGPVNWVERSEIPQFVVGFYSAQPNLGLMATRMSDGSEKRL